MLPTLATRNQNRIQSLFDDNFFSPLFDKVNNWKEDENNYYMNFDLPGFSKDDIELTIEKDMISLSAKNKNRREVQYMISSPAGIDTKGITANLENGVLSITLPKAEQAKPRQIQIT